MKNFSSLKNLISHLKSSGSLLVKRLIIDEEYRRKFMLYEWKLLGENIKENFQEVKDFRVADIQKQVLQRITNDHRIFRNLYSKILIDLKPVTDDIPYAFRYIKMERDGNNLNESVLSGAKKVIDLDTQGNAFSKILKGDMPSDVIKKLEQPILLGDNNSQSTYLSAFLLTTMITTGNCTQNYKNLNIGNVYIQSEQSDFYEDVASKWKDNSSILQTFSLPTLSSEVFNQHYYEKCFTYASDVNQVKTSFTTVHSGYAYGGISVEIDVIRKAAVTNPYIPHDCSSLEAYFYDCGVRFSTGQQINFVQQKINEQKKLKVSTMQQNSAQYVCLNKTFTPLLNIKDVENLKAGDIFFYPGHTGIILGKVNNQIVTFEASRNMPKVEGIGYCFRDKVFFNANQVKKVQYLRPKEQKYSDKPYLIPAFKKFLAQESNNFSSEKKAKSKVDEKINASSNFDRLVFKI